MKRIIIDSLVIIILAIIIVSVIYYVSYEEECDQRAEMKNIDPNYNVLNLNYDNSSSSYSGEIGPILDNKERPIEGAEVELVINEYEFYCITNANGMAKLVIPSNIINSTDLTQKYDILITKSNYHDISMKVNIELLQN
jgi:hypothetical protein